MMKQLVAARAKTPHVKELVINEGDQEWRIAKKAITYAMHMKKKIGYIAAAYPLRKTQQDDKDRGGNNGKKTGGGVDFAADVEDNEHKNKNVPKKAKHAGFAA